jgi:hypothetical protein
MQLTVHTLFLLPPKTRLRKGWPQLWSLPGDLLPGNAFLKTPSVNWKRRCIVKRIPNSPMSEACRQVKGSHPCTSNSVALAVSAKLRLKRPWYILVLSEWWQMDTNGYTMVYDDIRWYTHMHAFLMPAIKTSWPECQSVCWVRAWMPWTMLRQRPIFRNSADASFSPVWQVGSHRYCQIQPVLHRGIYNAECQLHILLVAIWELPNVLT